MRVLVADDDELTRKLLESLLTGWGYSVVLASDGDEAWKMLCELEHPHLVILDWMMPGIEGTEIVRKLRKKEGGIPHYVIIVTSGNSENGLLQALNSGADEFITKPINHAEFQARVNVGRRVTWLNEILAERLLSLELANETISRLALTDELTGLNNRRFFNECSPMAISAARRHGQPLSLVCIDLDNFKRINDTFGHAVGDQVLKEFSAILKKLLRVEDIACRWGGEEFIILLPNTTCEAAVALAERIRLSIEEYPERATPSVTASFGVARLQCGDNEDAFIRRADDALYQAKREGRNRVVAAG